MKRFVLAALAAVALVLGTGHTARAQSLVSVFTTVDAVRVDGDELWVTGVLSGQTASTERSWSFVASSTDQTPNIAALQSCERLALMAMSKPGAYLLEMTTQAQYYYYPKCKLVRRVP